jgi:hypothetical protein
VCLLLSSISHNIRKNNSTLNPYNNIKSRIVYNDSVSNFFPCLNGVRQGELFVSVRTISK